MSRVCPSCGYDQLSEQIDWCPRCNEFLAWDGNGGDTVDSSGESATVAAPAIAPALQAAGTAGRVVLRLRGPGEETTSDWPVELSVEAGQHGVAHRARPQRERDRRALPAQRRRSAGRLVVGRARGRAAPVLRERRVRDRAGGRDPPAADGARARRALGVPGRRERRRADARGAGGGLGGRPAVPGARARRTPDPWPPAGGGRGSTPTSATSATRPLRSTSGRPSSRTAAASCCPPRASASCRARRPRSRSASGRASRSSSGARPIGCSSCGRGRPTTSPARPYRGRRSSANVPGSRGGWRSSSCCS